jgi:hypothetical protein
MTYTGIAMLVVLGDDLSKLNRKKIIEGKYSTVSALCGKFL